MVDMVANIPRHIRGLLAASILLLVPATSYGDLVYPSGAEVAPTIAEITVADDGVHVALEIFPSDAVYFSDILPDAAFGDDTPDRPDETARLDRFAREVLRVEPGDDAALPVKVERVEPRTRKDRASPFAGMINPQTGQRIPGPPDDKRVIFAELFYPLGDRPDVLKITPPKGDDGRVLLTIGFIAFHKAIPVIDFRYLSDTVTLRLDWDDPWYTRFDNPNLKRRHKNALTGFLYVEPRTIRVEALVRIRDLQNRIDLKLNDSEVIAVNAQDEILRQAALFFARSIPVTADGIDLEEAASRASFVEIGTGGLTVIEDPRPLDRSTALIGVVTDYNIETMPQEVVLDWRLFDERNEQVPVTLYDPAGPLFSFAMPDDRKVVWHNSLKTYSEPRAEPVQATGLPVLAVPVISTGLTFLALGSLAYSIRPSAHRRIAWLVGLIGLVGAPAALSFARVEIGNPLWAPPTETALAENLTAMFDNIYVALDEHDPERRGQAFLTTAADGERERIEEDALRGLVVGLAGGSQARQYDLSDMAIRNLTGVARPGGIAAVATWKADVSGGHWGHVHRRKVEFEAQVELVPQKGSWKIAALTVTRRR